MSSDTINAREPRAMTTARSFQNKTVLVTGAGGGIGRAAALAFAHEGANVVIADLDEVNGAESLRLIESEGGNGLFVSVDVTENASVEAMVKSVVLRYGRLDCAFNNAGIAIKGAPIADMDEIVFDRIMAVNAKGVWLCMKYELRQMLAQGGGAIVNIGSIASFSGMSAVRSGPSVSSAYITSKHAVVGLTRAAAMEYAKDNIRVNAVCPGAVHTPMFERMLQRTPSVGEASANMHPMGRIAQSTEIADAVVWLCSDRARFVTGHMLAVDGGFGAA